MLKKMNLPNKLTILRIILVPIFVVFMCLPIEWVWPVWTSLGIFVLAAITDMLDGQISRRKNLVTKFGKIMDPLADKLLISSGVVMLSALQVIPGWIAVIIVFRDLFVDALRMFGADKGEELAADIVGKIKTVFELLAVIIAIISLTIPKSSTFAGFIFAADSMNGLELLLNIVMTVMFAGAVITTLWSMVMYIIKFSKDINVEE